MRRLGAPGAAAALLATGGLLSGCEVDENLAASCYSQPQIVTYGGQVHFRGEIPHEATAGERFEIRVDSMSAYAQFDFKGHPPAPDPDGYDQRNGTLRVSGAVEPAGEVTVSEDELPGSPTYPTTLEFTATGEPGDTITVTAVGGGNILRELPVPTETFCSVVGDGELATITIVAPE